MGKSWKLSKGRYAYVTDKGKRGIETSAAKAREKAGLKTSTKRKVSKTGKKKGTRRRGMRIVGNIGPKGLIVGSGLLALAKYGLRRFFPQAGAYTTGLAAIGGGAVGAALGTGKSLLQFGVVDAVSELITDLVLPGGMVTIPGMGPQVKRGYDL